MGHEQFSSAAQAIGERPSAELARRFFDTGRVAGVHLYGNIITVDLQKGYTSDGLADIVRYLYQYWKPGMVPPTFDDVAAADEAPAAAAGGAGAGDATTAVSAAASRVPAELLERSRAALAKWRATHG